MKVNIHLYLSRVCLIIGIMASFTFSSCGFVPFYAVGQRFNPQLTAELVKGKSTREDVVKLFGQPLQTSVADPAKSAWWRYSYVYLGNLGVQRANMEIQFKDNVVEDYQLEVTDSRY